MVYFRLENKTAEIEHTLSEYKQAFESLHQHILSLQIKTQDLRYDLEDLTAVVLNSTKVEEIIPKGNSMVSMTHFTKMSA